MKRLLRLLLGVASVVPLIGLLVYLALLDTVHTGQMTASVTPTYAVWVLGSAVVVALTLFFFYLQWIVRSSRLTAWRKVMWIFLLVVAGLITMPVLWYIHFRTGAEGNTPGRSEAA